MPRRPTRVGGMTDDKMREKHANSPGTTRASDDEASATAREMVGLCDDSDANATSLIVLEELRAFRKDFQDFKADLTTANERITETETRINNVEDRVQNMESVLTSVLKVMYEQENKLIDQESRSRRKNLRLYNVREGAEEGTSMVNFIERLLKETLDMQVSESLGIERAHRAIAPKPTGAGGEKARSIIIRFARFTTKEKILRKAWEKKVVQWEDRRIYFDQDYPPAILQKRKEYTEAKQVLKRHNIRFQTPYPYKLRVFYQNDTRLYQSAQEATADMIKRGLPVTQITTKESMVEQLAKSAWTIVGTGRRQHQEDRQQSIREKLQIYRRSDSTEDTTPISED